MGSDVTMEDHSQEVIDAKNNAVEKALEMIGLKAEAYAKLLCPHDTGLLRNSITHAVSGQSPAIGSYHADRGDGSGSYSGSMPNDFFDKAVYIGTNVEYAPYVEMGTQRTRAQPFIKPAATGHAEEYMRIAKNCLQNA